MNLTLSPRHNTHYIFFYMRRSVHNLLQCHKMHDYCINIARVSCIGKFKFRHVFCVHQNRMMTLKKGIFYYYIIYTECVFTECMHFNKCTVTITYNTPTPKSARVYVYTSIMKYLNIFYYRLNVLLFLVHQPHRYHNIINIINIINTNKITIKIEIIQFTKMMF